MDRTFTKLEPNKGRHLGTAQRLSLKRKNRKQTQRLEIAPILHLRTLTREAFRDVKKK